jgi:hypothetical protein
MRLHHCHITWLSTVAVLVAGCSGTQSQGALPGALASKAAVAQSAIGPSRSLPRQLLYVANTLFARHFPGVTVYPQRGSDQRRIGSITKGVDHPTGLAVDTSENLYVGNLGNSTVTVYPRASKGPSESLTNAGAPYGVAVGRDGTVYVANHGTETDAPSILVYPKGQTTPSQTIPIAKGSPYELALDSFGNLYATVGAVVYEFAQGSSQSKKLRLRGLAGFLTGIAFDGRNELLVVDNRKNARDVFVFPYGEIRPSQKIGINSTQTVIGIAINRENNEIWVTTFGGDVEGISYPGGTLLDTVHNKALTTGVALSPASNA